MAAPASQTQWYLARDGNQFGPITEAELAKFIDLGHLQPTDLLWREGFPDWRPAMVVFPQRSSTVPRPAPMPHPANPPTTAGRQAARGGYRQPPARPAPQGDRARRSNEEQDPPRRRRRGRALIVIILIAAVGAAGWLGYQHQAKLKEFVGSLSALAPAGMLENVDRKSLAVPPLKGFSGSLEGVDATLQNAALWRVLKREFPEWYTERLRETVALASENKGDAAIGQQMARALVALRRQHVDNALSASMPRLKSVATAFFDNLVQLRKHSVEACYGFISQGEASPLVVALLQGSEHTAHLQAQMTAVFEAIAEGRKSPRVYPQPRKTDYETLAADLAKRGWSQADMQLFSDERALARAMPEKVCQMVHDWFAAQLSIKDPDTQLRLLVDSLRPVVAG